MDPLQQHWHPDFAAPLNDVNLSSSSSSSQAQFNLDTFSAMDTSTFESSYVSMTLMQQDSHLMPLISPSADRLPTFQGLFSTAATCAAAADSDAAAALTGMSMDFSNVPMAFDHDSSFSSSDESSPALGAIPATRSPSQLDLSAPVSPLESDWSAECDNHSSISSEDVKSSNRSVQSSASPVPSLAYAVSATAPAILSPSVAAPHTTSSTSTTAMHLLRARLPTSVKQELDEDKAAKKETVSKKRTRRAPTSLAKAKAAAAAAAAAAEMEDDDDGSMSGLCKRERNKISASKYRKRRKMYVDTLEDKLTSAEKKVSHQVDQITSLTTENKVLKEQLSFFKNLLKGNPAVAAAPKPHNNNGALMFVLFACFLFCSGALWPAFQKAQPRHITNGEDFSVLKGPGRVLLSIENHAEIPAENQQAALLAAFNELVNRSVLSQNGAGDALIISPLPTTTTAAASTCTIEDITDKLVSATLASPATIASLAAAVAEASLPPKPLVVEAPATTPTSSSLVSKSSDGDVVMEDVSALEAKVAAMSPEERFVYSFLDTKVAAILRQNVTTMATGVASMDTTPLSALASDKPSEALAAAAAVPVFASPQDAFATATALVQQNAAPILS